MTLNDLSDTLGVVVVTYDCADVIIDCLESLLAVAPQGGLRICVVDNASQDDTVEALRAWAKGGAGAPKPSDDLPLAVSGASKPVEITEIEDAQDQPEVGVSGAGITLIHTGQNGGFAFGVNRGLRALMTDPTVTAAWILNPDAVVSSGTLEAIAQSIAQSPDFGLLGGRIFYLEDPDMIQTDNGKVNVWSGRTESLNMGCNVQTAKPVARDAIDFIAGANLIASRAYIETVGLMKEDYFLYYEEVDWSMRGKEKSQIKLHNPDIQIYHRAGASIGSATKRRAASPFSAYFMTRSRTMFVARHMPLSLPSAVAYSCAKAAQAMLQGQWRSGLAMLLGTFRLPPPHEVRSRLSDEVLKKALRSH